MRFHVPVGLSGVCALGLLLVQRRFNPVLYEAPLDPINFLHADRQRLGYPLVRQREILKGTLVATK